jgi:uncharacterized protein
MRWILPIGVFALCVATADTQAASRGPSFDCAKARSSDERVICSDPRLSELDRLAAAAYELARAKLGEEQVRERAQWLLSSRRACGHYKVCILDRQLNALKTYRSMGGISVSVPEWVATYQNRLAATEKYSALPRKIGECVTTVIVEISDRFGEKLKEVPTRDIDPGASVNFANSGYQVSYERESVILRSRVGDRVRMCLVSIPKDCPPGDDRGRFYTTTNLRTGEAWTLPDAEHMCGGA